MHELPINKKKLDSLIKEMKHHNEFPIFLPRYLASQSNHPISNLLDDLVNEAFTYLKIATDEEIKSLIDSLPPVIAMITDPISKWEEDEEKRKIALCYIATEVQRRYLSFKLGGFKNLMQHSQKNSRLSKRRNYCEKLLLSKIEFRREGGNQPRIGREIICKRNSRDIGSLAEYSKP